jgi:hypothetical protein
MAGALAACGGGGDDAASSGSSAAAQGSVTIPTPTPPTPASSTTDTGTGTGTGTASTSEERLVLSDNMLYAPGDYFAYPGPWCTAYDSSLIIGDNIVDTISLLRSTFPNDVIISAMAPDHYPTAKGCGVYGYHYVAFGNYLSANTAATMQPRRIRDLTTLSLTFDMTLSGSGEYNILTESFVTAAAKDFSTKLEIGFLNHAAPPTLSYARTGTAIGTYVDPAGRSWTVTKADAFVIFLHEGGTDLLSGTLDIKDAFAFLVARGVLTGEEWFNGVTTGLEPVKGSGVATIRQWNVAYN